MRCIQQILYLKFNTRHEKTSFSMHICGQYISGSNIFIYWTLAMICVVNSIIHPVFHGQQLTRCVLVSFCRCVPDLLCQVIMVSFITLHYHMVGFVGLRYYTKTVQKEVVLLSQYQPSHAKSKFKNQKLWNGMIYLPMRTWKQRDE